MHTTARDLPLLRGFAEELFEQMRMFGRMAFGERGDPAKNEELLRAVSVIRGFFKIFEELAGLEFDEDEAMLLYHTQGWPPEAPPAGRSGPAAHAHPSDVATSYLAFWVGSGYPKGQRPSVGRLVKAGGWLLMTTKDLTATIEYLFDLLHDGLVLDGYDVAWALDALLTAWKAASSDDELPRRLFGDTPPKTAAELIDAHPVVSPEAVAHRALPPSALEKIVELADAQIVRARSATNYQEWLVEHVVLERVLRAAKALLESHAPSSPGLTAALDQYEEMYCDGGAIHAGASRELSPYINTYTSTFVILFNAQGRLDRLRTDRAILPDAIAERLLKFEPLPPEWQTISPAFAAVLGLVLFDGGGTQIRFVRSHSFTPSEIHQSKRVSEALTSLGVTAEDARLAVIHDALERPRPAELAAVEVKISDLPFEPETEDERDKRRQLAAKLEQLATSDELHVLFESALAAPPPERAQRLEAAAALYPYFSPFQHELAIVYDEHLGDSERAFRHIRDAVLLWPTEAIYWQSLAVICRHLSSLDDALPARVVSEWLASEEWKKGDEGAE